LRGKWIKNKKKKMIKIEQIKIYEKKKLIKNDKNRTKKINRKKKKKL
jgi:hypothetical protein